MLSNLDLVSVVASFLSISDLFRASSVSTSLSSLFSTERVWAPLLSSALLLSTVPPSPFLACPLPALSVPVPPSAVASRLCSAALSAHLHGHGRAVAARGHRLSVSRSVTVIAIRRQPGSLAYHMRAALRAMVGASKGGSVARDEVDCRCYELEWRAELRDWRVAEVGEAGSGWSVLNAVDEAANSSFSSSSSYDDGKDEMVSDAWDDDTALHASTSVGAADKLDSDASKQQYIATFACSCHPQHRCFYILAPRPPLPAPAPAANAFPGLFSEHHASLLPYPSHAPLPVCSSCRSAVASFVSSSVTASSALHSSVQVRCVVRVNVHEWDVRYLQYECGCVYRRVQLQWSYARVNSGGGWQVVRVYRAHSGAYCNQLPANVD